MQGEKIWATSYNNSVVISSPPLSLTGNINKNNVTLSWTVAENENINNFAIERSINGGDFKTIVVFLTSEKNGIENYMYYENVKTGKIKYRLKIINKHNGIEYSGIIKIPGSK